MAATALGVILFFCHIIALAAYGLLLFAIEAGTWWGRPASQRWRIPAISKSLVRLAVPFVIPALLYLQSPLAEVSGPIGWNIPWKLRGVFGPFATYNLGLDLLAMLAVASLLGWCSWRGNLLLARAGAISLGILLILYPIVPFGAMGAGYIDQRLTPLAAFLLFAGTLPRGLGWSLRPLATVALAAIATIRLADIGAIWAGHNQDLVELWQVTADIRPGERVLVVTVTGADVSPFRVGQSRSRFFLVNQPSILHLPALVLIEHDAFSPLLFSAASKQPLRVRPLYAGIAVEGEGYVPSYRTLWIAAAGKPLPEDAPYLAYWQRDFDYVLLMYAGKLPVQDQPLLPDRLDLLRRGDVAALYRVRRSVVPRSSAGESASTPGTSQ